MTFPWRIGGIYVIHLNNTNLNKSPTLLKALTQMNSTCQTTVARSRPNSCEEKLNNIRCLQRGVKTRE